MSSLQVLLYVVAGFFVVMSFLMIFAYRRIPHYGLLAMSFAYSTAGCAAILVNQWWPLLVGYGVVWVMKLKGFDPADRAKDSEPPRASGTDKPNT